MEANSSKFMSSLISFLSNSAYSTNFLSKRRDQHSLHKLPLDQSSSVLHLIKLAPSQWNQIQPQLNCTPAYLLTTTLLSLQLLLPSPLRKHEEDADQPMLQIDLESLLHNTNHSFSEISAGKAASILIFTCLG
jgi:hypothetical protein